ncbi:MAG: hypothetical protein HYU66_19535, partial [Armatimonadetes bacterium]|nr:hypothetical protein [Armatimonadota bacterium]
MAAGDGANGGDGLLGGAGGDGGSVAITAAGQTVTLHESPGFIHLGDGGAGGTGVVGGQALLVFEVPEQVPSAGGGSGHLVVDAAVVAGVPAGEPVLDSQGQSHPTFVLAADSVTGGDGGDGGDWHYGVAPGSEASTWPSNRGPSVGRVGTSPVAVRGANGGDAEFQGGNGGDARVVRSGQAVGAGADAGDVTAVGGNGGD